LRHINYYKELKAVALLNVICSQYDRFMEREKAAAATKTIDAEWRELQMLMSALKVCGCSAYC